ncbi:MAG: fibronectin type III domain-containing protein [Patescibacteria group bacterium]|jgi:hypothetical protein
MKKLLLVCLFLIAPFALRAEDAINIDGDFSDWDAINESVTDAEDITGTWYYYNSGVWQGTCPEIDPLDGTCESFMVNQEQQLDFIQNKVANGTNYFYLYFQSAEPLGAVLNGSNGVYTGRDAFGVPAAYDHWLIAGIDATADDEPDYYYAFHITWDASGVGFPSDDPSSYLYSDKDQDGVFTIEDGVVDETLLQENVLLEWNIDTTDYSPKMEMKLDLNNFLEQSGLSSNQDLGVIFLTDETLNDSTPVLAYNFSDNSTAINVPSGLDTSSLQSTSANLTWNEVSGAEEYQVQLRLESGAAIENYYTETLSQKVDKTVLLSNNQYKFRVRAKISGTWQEWSTYYSFQTLPAKPTHVRVNRKQADQILLKWDKPRGDISEYMVKLYSKNNKVIESYTLTNEQKSIKTLLPNTEYKAKVKAFNGDISSNWTSAKEFTTGEIGYYIKIKDVTKTNLNVGTPGADIDSIKIIDDDYDTHYVEQVVKSRILNGSAGNSNGHDHVNEIIGISDGNYCSLGGYGAFAVVKFSSPVNYKVRSATILELGSSTGGYDEPVRVFVGPSEHGPWSPIGKGGGEYVINL